MVVWRCNQELYYTNDYGSCVTLTYAGPLAGEKVKLQCNSDNTITYGEERCGEDLGMSQAEVPPRPPLHLPRLLCELVEGELRGSATPQQVCC